MFGYRWPRVKAELVHRRPEASALESRVLLSNVLFNDDFNLPAGAQPLTSTWHYRNGTDPNNANVQYTNTPSTLHVVNDPGALDGKALAMTLSPDPASPGKFLSSEIQTTADPVASNLLYGRIEARIKLPGGPSGQGVGIWPAFWMLGSNFAQVGWPNCGEIDIMENKGSTPGGIQGTIHGPGYSGGSGITAHYYLPAGQTFYSGYHTFAVDWAPNWIAFSVDGHVYATRTPADLPSGKTWVFNHSFHINLDVCEGGSFAGPTGPNSTFPQTMLVDYVRAYRYLPGDLNGDGAVDFNDLLILAQHYGQPGTFPQGDLNGDGTVGFDDLLILAQNYGRTSVPQSASAIVSSLGSKRK